jgi:hypothetical protein
LLPAESGCPGRGRSQDSREEAGPKTSDRGGGTDRWGKKVGQRWRQRYIRTERGTERV